jgi:hypothetical protein
MRLAKLNDFRRRLKERGDDWVLKLERFAFEDMPGTGTGEIALGSPIAVVSRSERRCSDDHSQEHMGDGCSGDCYIGVQYCSKIKRRNR